MIGALLTNLLRIFLQIAPAKRKRKYGTNKSLSRKQRGGSSKWVSVAASKASSPRSSAMSEDTISCVNLTQHTTNVKHNLQMQLRYKKYKESKSQQRLQELQLQVTSLDADKQCLNYINEKAQEQISKLNVSITKVTEVLDRRTERWAAAKDKCSAEIRHVKQAASHRLVVLQKNHEAKLRSEQSLRYHSERCLGKAIVQFESQLDSVRRNAEYVQQLQGYKDTFNIFEYSFKFFSSI